MTQGQGSDQTADAVVIARILDGRVDDFAILLDRYRGYVCKVVSSLLPPDLVSELAHEVFVEAYRSLPQYDTRKAFKNWLAGIALRHCRSYWRQHYRNREIPLSALGDEHHHWVEAVIAEDASALHENAESRHEARDILEHLLAGLSPKDRMVLTLVHLDGYTVKEAAEMLGWSVINVKVRAYRSREKIRKQIAALLAEEERA